MPTLAADTQESTAGRQMHKRLLQRDLEQAHQATTDLRKATDTDSRKLLRMACVEYISSHRAAVAHLGNLCAINNQVAADHVDAMLNLVSPDQSLVDVVAEYIDMGA